MHWICRRISSSVSPANLGLRHAPDFKLVKRSNVNNTMVSQMKTLNMFYVLICWTQKVHNDFIFLRSIVLPPVGHSSNYQYQCWILRDSRAVVPIFIALLRFSFESPSYFAWMRCREITHLSPSLTFLRLQLTELHLNIQFVPRSKNIPSRL